MPNTFTWNPDMGPTGTHDVRVLTANYGDGYVQDAGNGINTDLPVWTVRFSNRGYAEYSAIVAFLVALNPAVRFYWTPPGGAQALFKCTKFVETPFVNGFAAHSVTATFSRVVA